MALQSQAPRANVNRRFAGTNGRRKTALAPWLALAGVVIVLAGLYFLFAGGSNGAAEHANAAPGDGAATPAPDTGRDAAAGQTGGQSPAPRRPDGQTVPPNPSLSNTQQRPTTPPPAGHTPVRPTAAQLAALGAGGDDAPLRGESKDQFETGMQLIESGDKIAGRALLSELLFREGSLPRHEAQAVRELLAHENQRLVFSKEKISNDTITTTHTVQSGEYLGPIANAYRVPYQLIERINGISANRLQAGQNIKVLRGPVHARIDKSDYRMDLFVEDPSGLRIFIKSYTVGLGEFDSTPIGLWRIKPGSKVGPDAANGNGPSWTNPRTNRHYASDDPDIPIGEYWMALEGIDANTQGKSGYGIHATNDPDSIGRQESMGCIRMSDQDVDEVFYTLFEGASTVEIAP